MAGKISFSGLASGLPPNIVDQLVEAERIPIKTIENQKGKQEARLKLVQNLKRSSMGSPDRSAPSPAPRVLGH